MSGGALFFLHHFYPYLFFYFFPFFLLKYQTHFPHFPSSPSQSTLSTRLHSILQCRSQYVRACLCVLRWTQGRPIYSSAAKVRERKQKWSASLQRIQSLTASSSAVQRSEENGGGGERGQRWSSTRPWPRMFCEFMGIKETELEFISLEFLPEHWEFLQHMHTSEILPHPSEILHVASWWIINAKPQASQGTFPLEAVWLPSNKQGWLHNLQKLVHMTQ